MNERSSLQKGMLGKYRLVRGRREKSKSLERAEDRAEMIKDMLTLNPLHVVYHMDGGRVSQFTD